MTIYTVGHSTRKIEEFIAALKSFDVRALADVRSIPGSRRAPQYNSEELGAALGEAGIGYLRLTKLGGRRRADKTGDHSLVAGWENASFRNYAAYTLTDEYEAGIAQLLALAEGQTVCIMCAESVPWRCHRSIISNTLVSRGVTVYHIMGERKAKQHALNMYGAQAAIQGGRVIYPAPNGQGPPAVQ